jgi:hypothetical protein
VILSPSKTTVNVTASEPNYTGILTEVPACNPDYVLVVPPVGLGPQATFTFTFEGAAPGGFPSTNQCDVTVYDFANSHQATVNVAIIGYTITLKPNAVTLSISNPQTVNLSVTESNGYNNSIAITNPYTQYITVSPLKATGPTANFKFSLVSGYKGGTGTFPMTISDVYNETLTFDVNVVN